MIIAESSKMVIVGSVSVGLTDLDRRRIYEVYCSFIDYSLSVLLLPIRTITRTTPPDDVVS